MFRAVCHSSVEAMATTSSHSIPIFPTLKQYLEIHGAHVCLNYFSISKQNASPSSWHSVNHQPQFVGTPLPHASHRSKDHHEPNPRTIYQRWPVGMTNQQETQGNGAWNLTNRGTCWDILGKLLGSWKWKKNGNAWVIADLMIQRPSHLDVGSRNRNPVRWPLIVQPS